MLCALSIALLHQSSCAMIHMPIETLYKSWFKPDRRLPTLEQLNIVTFLPIEHCADEKTIINEDTHGRSEIIKLLEKREGIIKVGDKLYRVHRGIPEEISAIKEPINLYLGGVSNACNPHAFSIYKGIKEGTMQGACVIFECPETRRSFNFCQEQDLHCVELAYNDLLKKHADAQVILKGGCKGASVLLRFLAEKAEAGDIDSLKNIKAFIASYPPISVKDALKDIRYGGALGYWFCRFTLPNYNPHAKTIFDATAFPKDIPVLLSCLPQGFDRMTDRDEMERIEKHLTCLGANIEFFVSKGFAKDSNGKEIKLGHGKLGRAQDYRETVKEFLAKHTSLKDT